MYTLRFGLLHENVPISREQMRLAGLPGRKCAEYEITRGEKLVTRDWRLGRLGTIELIPNFEFRIPDQSPVLRIRDRSLGLRIPDQTHISRILNSRPEFRIPSPVFRIPCPALRIPGPPTRAPCSEFRLVSRSPSTPLYAINQKELAIYSENLGKLYAIENKPVITFLRSSSKKTRGGKYEGKSHYVVENKYRKNVRNRPRHYMYENK